MANLYGIVMTHRSDTCPSANKAVWNAAEKMMSNLENLGRKYKVHMQSGYHFDPEHLSVVTVEAENAESVRDFVFAAGMQQWNDVRICMLTPMDKIMQKTSELSPPPYL